MKLKCSSTFYYIYRFKTLRCINEYAEASTFVEQPIAVVSELWTHQGLHCHWSSSDMAQILTPPLLATLMRAVFFTSLTVLHAKISSGHTLAPWTVCVPFPHSFNRKISFGHLCLVNITSTLYECEWHTVVIYLSHAGSSLHLIHRLGWSLIVR